jgi:hypothetical protein
MRSLTFNEKRVVAGIYLALLLFAAGNHYFEWGVAGDSSKRLLGVVMSFGVIAMLRFMPGLMREMEEHEAARRQVEERAERERDKSNDAAEAERVRRAIGMPPDSSSEGTSER